MRRSVARLAAFLFALQLAVPAGFMPNIADAKAGIYEVVICTGAGFKTITIDETGQPVDPAFPDGAPETGGFSCPFFKVAAKAVDQEDAPNVHRMAAVAVVHHIRRDQVPSPRIFSAYLGSRAPPANLG